MIFLSRMRDMSVEKDLNTFPSEYIILLLLLEYPSFIMVERSPVHAPFPIARLATTSRPVLRSEVPSVCRLAERPVDSWHQFDNAPRFAIVGNRVSVPACHCWDVATPSFSFSLFLSLLFSPLFVGCSPRYEHVFYSCHLHVQNFVSLLRH